MNNHYAVALVVDVDFGGRLRDLSERMDAWIVGTPENIVVAQGIRRENDDQRSKQRHHSITTMSPDTNNDAIGWWHRTIEALDLHHNEHSHDPGYTVLEVYGLSFSDALMPALFEYGFSTIEATAYGFRAERKHS